MSEIACTSWEVDGSSPLLMTRPAVRGLSSIRLTRINDTRKQ